VELQVEPMQLYVMGESLEVSRAIYSKILNTQTQSDILSSTYFSFFKFYSRQRKLFLLFYFITHSFVLLLLLCSLSMCV
jgi:hypothetical protein